MKVNTIAILEGNADSFFSRQVSGMVLPVVGIQDKYVTLEVVTQARQYQPTERYQVGIPFSSVVDKEMERLLRLGSESGNQEKKAIVETLRRAADRLDSLIL